MLSDLMKSVPLPTTLSLDDIEAASRQPRHDGALLLKEALRRALDRRRRRRPRVRRKCGLSRRAGHHDGEVVPSARDLCGPDAETPAGPKGVRVEWEVPPEVVRSLWQEELAATLLPANSGKAK